MRATVREFRDNYADRLADGMEAFLRRHGPALCARLSGAFARPRSTVYLFGNGGSHAIGKCFEFALRDYASSRGLALRVKTGVDVHGVNRLDDGGSPGPSFVSVLKDEGADERDLVVLISGSGDSDNLCEAASYAARLSIPTVALVGSSRGRLLDFVLPDGRFPVTPEDQQISEDVIQSLAHALERMASGAQGEDWDGSCAAHADTLRRAVKSIPEEFILAAAEALVAAFRRHKFARVLGLDHPALSVCAEHTAHNLYWDSVYQVDKPPHRIIWSSPTACDFSGISNDRRRGFMPHLTGAREMQSGGVALLYSMRLDRPQLLDVLDSLESMRVPCFVLSACGESARAYGRVNACVTGLEGAQAQAGVSQAFGHILGRVIRMMLLGRRPGAADDSDADSVRFLVEHDLAQRRLLDD